jgi:hypothetical protein
MRGGSQAALVDTAEGHFVVKWLQNPQHRRVLINEAVSSELLKQVGVASPAWAWIQVDLAFLEAHPEARIEVRRGAIAIEPGWHYGSRYPVDPYRQTVYACLPAHMVERVSNRKDFPGSLVFDVWTDNRDPAQAIFFRPPHRPLRMEMIDHGHALGFDGNDWSFSNVGLYRPYPGTRDIYSRPEAAKQYKRVIDAIRKVKREDLKRALDLLPPEWIENDDALLSRQFDGLIARADRLEHLVENVVAQLQSSPPKPDERQPVQVFPAEDAIVSSGFE